MRIVVIANCQCLPLARTIALGLTSHKCDFIDVNFVDREPFKERITSLQSDPPDFIFSFELSNRWDSLESSTLRSSYPDRFFSFTNIYFSGLHPDMTYIGAMGSRVQGYLSDYHSKLVLYAFGSGRSQDDCRGLFSEETFRKVGFYDVFEKSAHELRARDLACDIRFADKFLGMIKDRFCLYTLNHPTDGVLQELSKVLCEAAGLEFQKYPGEYLTNALSDNVIWPVYDPIAEYHGLRYRTPQTFVSQNFGIGRTSHLTEMISRFYGIYESDTLQTFKHEIRNLSFFREFETVLD